MNKIFLSGRIVYDLVLRYLSDGTPVLNFVVASDESYIKDGKKVEAAEFHSIVAFDKLAETIASYFKKGHGITVIGKLKTRDYQHKEFPVKIYKTEIHVDEFEFPIAAPKAASNGEKCNARQDASFDRGEPPAFN